jgi:hypothetical protein
MDLADHYFSIASTNYGARFTKESVLDHASVLLLLGDSKRAAALAASLADPSQISASILERAIYIQGAALLAAENYAGSKTALQFGLSLFPHSQQMKETLAEAESELAAALAGVSSNDAMTIRLLASPPIDIKPSYTLQFFDKERITSVAAPVITVCLTPVTLKANVAVTHGGILQPKVCSSSSAVALRFIVCFSRQSSTWLLIHRAAGLQERQYRQQTHGCVWGRRVCDGVAGKCSLRLFCTHQLMFCFYCFVLFSFVLFCFVLCFVLCCV